MLDSIGLILSDILITYYDDAVKRKQTIFGLGYGLRGIQAALVIRGLGIRGFDYSRVGKQGKTANGKGIFINLSLKQGFWYSRVQISQECNPANSEGNLYY